MDSKKGGTKQKNHLTFFNKIYFKSEKYVSNQKNLLHCKLNQKL